MKAKVDEKSPWDKEDWREAKGIIVKAGDTNSALAERDYSVECESHHLITKVKGYWVWWCSTHHQPLAWCQVAILSKQGEQQGIEKGRKEVVDSFLGAEIHSNPHSMLKAFNKILKAWQAFLKGIDKEE